MSLVVPVGGTWSAREGHSKWWVPDSPWCQALTRAGHQLLDREDPFFWSTNLDGLTGHNADWEAAGAALRWYCQGKTVEVPVLVGHSHGGSVIAYACARGLRARVVTVGTPVRAELQPIWRQAMVNIPEARHTHIWSDESTGGEWQKWGSLPLPMGFAFTREMPLARDNVYIAGQSHQGLMEVSVWDDQNLWRLIDGSP